MRVTNQMLTRNVLQNLQSNLSRMQKYQQQLSSGRVINRPSDNPLSASRIMGLNSSLATGEQYKKNIDAGLSWMGMTETALGGANDVLQRARELTVYGATGTLSDEARNAIAQEVEQLSANLLQIANSSIEQRYIFGGFKTSSAPFVLNGDTVEYQGDLGKMKWEVAQGVTMEMNLNGQELFMESDIFNVLKDLETSLRNGEISEQGGAMLERLDSAINQVLDFRATVGARVNRLEMAESRNYEEKVNMKTIISSLSDVDFAEAMMQYSLQESVYHASLSTGARTIQPSLVDFLR